MKKYKAFTFEQWLKGKYQTSTEDYLNDNFGFRSLFVRINNQLRFSLFNKSSNSSVIIGKNNFLYEYGYVLAYNGKDYLGKALIDENVSKIKLLQDTLAIMGKRLLIVMAPSKVRIYPEYISDSLVETLKTNYHVFKSSFAVNKINFIDFNAVFLNKKNIAAFPLYPTLGVHWSHLEALYAYDTIIKRLSYLSDLHLPKIIIANTIEKDELEDPDDDAGKSLNLIQLPNYQKMGYAEFMVDKTNKDLSNLTVIGDSYWWDIFLQKLPKKTFLNNEFWYYNKEIWGNNSFEKFYVDSIDVKRKILQSDFIVIIATESNLSRLGFGFFDLALRSLRKPIYPTISEINDYKTEISKNKAWMDQIKAKASEKKISTDSMLTLDAKWIFQIKGPKMKEIKLNDCKKHLFKNREWIEEIGMFSYDKKVTVDSAISYYSQWYLEKIYQVETNHPKFEKQKIGDLSLIQIKELIKHNLDWMKEIRNKAAAKELSVDSIITLDAIWYKKHAKDNYL